nr:hypothetical protein [Tanacetum cinerariifolium]
MGDSPEGILVVVYWFLNPHYPRHLVFNPLDMPLICYLCLRNRSSILAACSTKILEVVIDEVLKWNNMTTSVVWYQWQRLEQIVWISLTFGVNPVRLICCSFVDFFQVIFEIYQTFTRPLHQFISRTSKKFWGQCVNSEPIHQKIREVQRKLVVSVVEKTIQDAEKIVQLLYGFAVNWESARDVYSKRRIIAVTELKIVEWHNYKNLDWITVRRDDDKLYKFKEGDFKRLRIQGIEDMLLLLVQGKLTNLIVEERFAFNVSLRMFTRSIVIQRHVEDLQLGVESSQKKLNLTRPDSYRTDLKRKEAYNAYSNPRGFIYQNKDKRNRLMRIDELHKFSDGMLIDVRTALDDRLKGIRMQYLPTSIWRKIDKDRATAMIQAIDKMLKTRRIMRSLERFVGGRLYEGDLGMLQRTI